MNSERDKAAEEYADRIMNTLEDADARVRSFKAGWDAALKSSVVKELIRVLEFYADKDNWQKHPDFYKNIILMSEDDADFDAEKDLVAGAFAREALSLYRNTVGDE
jgi:DNA gyrase/topoisomerase IV subunit B